MKNRLLIFCAFALVTTTTVTAYNSRTGPALHADGVEEANKERTTDSLASRGKQIVIQKQLSETDLEAISTYLDNR